MPKLYLASVCDDEVGEVEGIFDEAGEMLGTWCSNDALWRTEYFGPFLAKLGFDMRPWTPSDLDQKLVAHWRGVLSLDGDE